MSKFEKVKAYFDKHLWTALQVRNAVTKAWITAEQYEEITGKVYAAE
ncbi:MAG: XkdX family protein [Paludibacteraceae bacterium]